MTYKQRDWSERSYSCNNCGKQAAVEYEWGEPTYPEGWLQMPWSFVAEDACSRECALALSAKAIDAALERRVPA